MFQTRAKQKTEKRSVCVEESGIAHQHVMHHERQTSTKFVAMLNVIGIACLVHVNFALTLITSTPRELSLARPSMLNTR